MKTKVYFIELNTKNNFIKYFRYIKYLSYEKQIKLYRFRFDVDKKLCMFSELFMNYLIYRNLKIKKNSIYYKKNKYGKPYLSGYTKFKFNISHTNNAIAICISEKPIGIDIEKIKSNKIKIAQRFFCKNEIAYILAKNKNIDKRFYEIWTKKEAYIKWRGKGLSQQLKSFDTTEKKIINMLSVKKIINYIISVCSKENINNKIIKLNEDEVYKIIQRIYK